MKTIVVGLGVLLVVTVTFVIAQKSSSISASVPTSAEDDAASSPSAPITQTPAPLANVKTFDKTTDSGMLNDFRSQLADSLSTLPTFDSLDDNNDADAHVPSIAFSTAMNKLGRIRAEISQDRKKLGLAVPFYRSCASKSGVLPSIRALCLRNLMDIKSATGHHGLTISLADYPSAIARIASALPPLPFR